MEQKGPIEKDPYDSYIDEKRKCVYIPIGEEKIKKYDVSEIVFITLEVEKLAKYSGLKFTGEYKTDDRGILLFYERNYSNRKNAPNSSLKERITQYKKY